jgi:hypothetical protein
VKRAAEIESPVKIGTNTVAPNIAKTCWKLRGIHLERGGLSLVFNTILFSSIIEDSFL